MNSQHKAWNERQKRLVEYLGIRTLAGLLLMPATRHPFITPERNDVRQRPSTSPRW
ncbi:MAG: hypothetical protein JW726_03580 [Anaerolineales bacterium]|nr:hypothetical protein [Anaerolineales bacterium]